MLALGGVTLTLLLFVVVAGVAATDILKNLASGLQILSTRPFGVGDWIVVNAFEGTVVSVGWRGTALDTFDGRRVILPNAQIVNLGGDQQLDAPACSGRMCSSLSVGDADFAASRSRRA